MVAAAPADLSVFQFRHAQFVQMQHKKAVVRFVVNVNLSKSVQSLDQNSKVGVIGREIYLSPAIDLGPAKLWIASGMSKV